MIFIAYLSMLLVFQDAKSMSDASTDSTSDGVVILAVSTRLGQDNTEPVGSIMGGTLLYMKVQGLDQTASNNAVYIGKYPCVISDKGVNGLFMNCRTTQPDPSETNLSNLNIVVRVSDKPDSLCMFSKTYCHFTYSQDYTPKLQYVTPRSNFPRSLSYWRARWTVSSTLVQHLNGQFIGKNRCDRFTVQDDYSDEIDSNDDIVVCQVSAEIEAGYYSYTINSENGYQINDVGISQTKVYEDVKYDSKYENIICRIAPIITSLNTNYASPQGQLLQITGYGFSITPANNVIKISGQPNTVVINVIKATPTLIIAEVPKLASLPKKSELTSTNLFIQGSGLFYTRYNVTGMDGLGYGDCGGLRTKLINTPNIFKDVIEFDGIYPEPDVQNTFGENYGEYFRGFLKAPITGNYKFYLTSDDCSEFYIQSTTAMSITRPTTAAAAVPLWGKDKNYWEEYYKDPTKTIKSISENIALTQDQYYYIELYHINGGSLGFVTLSMEVENTGARRSNSMTSLYAITTSYTPTKEKIAISLYNSGGNTLLTGTFKLQFAYGMQTTPQTDVYYDYTTDDFSMSSSVTDIKSSIEWYCGYSVTVTKKKLDNTGTELDDAATAFAGYKFTITFDSYRGDVKYRSLPKLTNTLTGGTLVSNIVSLADPTAPISGTFELKMTIDGVDNLFQVEELNYDLPFDTSASLIADNIERITGTRPLVWTQGKAQDGWTWYVKLKTSVQGLTAFTGSGATLVSGSGAVTLTVQDKVPESNNLFFEPIPNELLFTYSTAPQVQVITNNILAGCQSLTACDLTLGDTRTPTLKAFSVAGSVLSLTLQSGVDMATIVPTDLTISFLGADCTSIAFTNSVSPYSVTCNLEQLNGQNIQEAGSNQMPKIHNKNIGYSLIDGALTGTSITLAVTSVSPSSGSQDGGAPLTIVGSGFPKNSERTFTITIGGVTVTPTSVNNQQIIVIAPASSTGVIVITYNGQTVTDSTSYTIDPSKRMEVVSLEFSSTTPVYRGLFTITGTNFGTVVSETTVTLVGATKSYNAKVISVTDTTVQVYLRGGMPGTYKVEVTRANYGTSYASGIANELKYIIPVTKVTLEDGTSLAKGSEAGGQIIKITGSHFVAGETMVFIGNAINWICEIDESRFTSDVIYCTVPAKNQYYSNPEQTVVVTLLITLESTCVATGSDKCTFTYDSTLNPVIDAYPTGTTLYSGSRILTEEDHQKPDYQKLVTRKRYLWTDESKKAGINHILNHGKSPRRDMLSSVDLVVSKMKTYLPGATETLTGTGLTATVNIVFVGPKTLSVSATVSSNQITYTIPALPQGQYTTYVQTLNGYADKIWLSVIGLSITAVTPSAIGGSIITITGSGFNAAKSPKVTIGSSSCTNLQVDSSTSITCRTGQQSGSTLTLSQLPSENNSATPLTATFTLTITAEDQSPAFASLTVNGANTFDNTKQAYTATAGSVALVITGSRLTGTAQVITLEHRSNKIVGTLSAQSSTSITASFTNLPAGVYSINIQIDSNYAYNSDTTKSQIIVSGSTPTSSKPSVSYAGGATITFTGTGFDSSTANNQVKLCGFDCPVQSSTFTSLTCEAPQLLTTSVLTQYSAMQQPARQIIPQEVTILADTVSNAASFFDLFQSTYYTSTAATNCYVSIDFGMSRALKLHQLRYIPRIDQAAIKLKGAVFQYSLDGSTWVTLLTIDQTVHTGWNIFVPAADISGIRAIRLFDAKGSTGSSCEIAEIELKGWVLSSSTNAYTAATSCDAIIQVNGQQLGTVSAAASYTSTSVPIVNTVSPLSGRFTEEVVITIVGTGFVSGQTTVTIDGVVCVIQSVSTTQIVCKTGIKDLDQTQLNEVFQVRVNGNLAINNQKFIYATKWSDLNTWGGFEQPGDGDSVIVNMGQTLIVDVKTPKLMQVLVEGTLTFSDEVDTSLDAHYIIIREGKFNIGTETQPHLHKVQITLHGQELDTQMPAMGNKVLGCHQCQLVIHGEERTPTWTLLSSTANVGATSITIDDAVDWRVGEQIFIASSQIDHNQAETRIITGVSTDKMTLILDKPLVYQHYSAVETYGTDQFPMKVEVGLMTRNIVIQADSSEDKYGYHLMIHGRAEKGSIGKISYAEFKHGGQPRIIGRYPIHFHLNGDVDQSYVIGNSIHDCYARCVTIHGVHYLKVQKNVCYGTYGHAIFLEDGIETNNVIEKNLVAGTRQSWIMLQTDITVATYWVTHPQNIVRDNRSGGSEWYGFWYEVKSNPDGPSATSDICPPGLNILEFNNNFAHSNGRFGLRIFQLAPRTLPCWVAADITSDTPFAANPSLQAVFQNFITWKNNEAGILAEQMGNVLFKNSMIADSGIAGFQSHKTDLSLEGTVLDTALIVGHSNGNANPFDYYNNTRAIIAPRTSGFTAKNIKIYNFGSNTALLGSCSLCAKKKFATGTPKTASFSNIKSFNSDQAGKVIFQSGLDLFQDLDGSFTGVTGGASVFNYKKHLDGITGCVHHPEVTWDDSLICATQQVTIRDVLVDKPLPEDKFAGADMKIYRLDSSNIGVKMNTNLADTDMELSKGGGTFYATGYSYNLHWKEGADDPTSMGVIGSSLFTAADKAVVLRFNYSSNRETFDINRLLGTVKKHVYANISAIPDTTACNHGDWFNDKSNKLFYFCVSGKVKTKYEYTQIEGVLCRDTCDSLGDVEQEDGYRYWSKPTTWLDGKVPVEGDSPVIQGAYKVIIDIDPPKLVNLTVLGTLVFDTTKEFTHLQAERIWVRSGKILAGDPENVFPGKITITLNGETNDSPLQIDSQIDVGNKVLAVTKGLELYSKVPGTVWTRLGAYANAGDTQVTVAECIDWVVGDEIVFGPSGGDPQQREKKKITALTGCAITLDSGLAYDHFGAPFITIDKAGIGQFDMRAIVGHLTRNIKIEGGTSASGLGCRVLIYHFIEPVDKVPRKGYAVLHGVEFNNCGQFNTDKSGLDFRFLNSEIVKTPSEVIGCSFHDSLGILFTIQNSQYLTVTNNIFYSGFRALAQIYNSQYVKFQNNALIYVKKKASSGGDPWGKDPNGWAALGSFVYTDSTKMTRDVVDISSNAGQGSEDSGFFVMAGSCSNVNQLTNYNIQCSCVAQACFAIRNTDNACTYVAQLYASHSQVGIIISVPSEETQLDKSIVVENGRGIIIKPGPISVQNGQVKISNIYISPLARPSCPKCYASALAVPCSGTMAIQLTTSSSAANMPLSAMASTSFDIICTNQKVDQHVFLNNVQFENIKLTYDSTFPTCSNNIAFRQHSGAIEMTGQHYLVNSPCINCEFDALLHGLISPSYAKLGWFGGCGSMICTGLQNLLVEDQTGDFFGQIGQAIGNNSYFGPNVTYCTRQESWNGYWCPGTKATVLLFMSTAPDHSSRLYSPIQLTDGQFFNQINSYTEWAWDGPEPLNTRESKFNGLVTVNSVINMTNAGTNPTQSDYWLSKKTETGSADWVIIKWQFQEPQIIQVAVNNQVVLPGLTTHNQHHDLSTMTDQCGANNYFYENRTIHFVVTGKIGCKVSISMKNTLQVSTRLSITTDQFFGDKFLQYARASIGGDPYNFFIIGTKKAARRFLGEESVQQIDLIWGIVDSAQIGTIESKNSNSNLAALASKLGSLTVSEELKQLGVVGLEVQSTKIQSISELKYSSTEATSSTSQSSSGGTTTGNSASSGNTGSTSGGTTNSTDTGSYDDLILIVDEGVNQQEQDNEVTPDPPGPIQAVKTSESNSDTVTIVLSVIFSVLGVALIAFGIVYYKKRKINQIMAIRSQRVDNNEMDKQNIMSERVDLGGHEEQSAQEPSAHEQNSNEPSRLEQPQEK